MLDSEVQQELENALEALESNQDKNKEAEIGVAKLVLTILKERVKSGNGIPALRGMGLEEALTLAREINSVGMKNLRINTKALAQSLI